MNPVIVGSFAICAGATLAAIVATPIVIRAARLGRFCDLPDGVRKQHGASTPLGGGVAVFVAATLIVALAYCMVPGIRGIDPSFLRQQLHLVAALSVILIVGLYDDRYGLRGAHKLLGQVVASLILIAGGFVFFRCDVLGWRLELGHFGYLVTLGWLLGTVNAINLMDGADGVASTLGIGICSSLAAIAFFSGHPETAVVPLALAGALAGFLVFNLPPAKIYLGDGGSMVLGLAVGAVAIQASIKSQATFAVAAPVALLTLPLLDTGYAIFRRILTGRSIYDTDRGHLHHRLLHQGVTPLRLVLVVALVTAVTSIAAIASLRTGADAIALVTALAVVVYLAIQRIIGHGEWRLITWHLRQSRNSTNPTAIDQYVHLQGRLPWSGPWKSLTRQAHRQNWDALQVTLSLPWLHEAFHARWGNAAAFRARNNWTLRLPLSVLEKQVGWVEIAGGTRPAIGAPQQALDATAWSDLTRIVNAFQGELTDVAVSDSRLSPAPESSSFSRQPPYKELLAHPEV
ncbi:MAG: MraY family glycosyltransferase [Pirellulaceae bacterium]|nr:undecaprenyl/decaprenyl-phosphate alpha-N-acetylglucosaminyl 1-phosphate transferase [Planctomycetales bacterium]